MIYLWQNLKKKKKYLSVIKVTYFPNHFLYVYYLVFSWPLCLSKWGKAHVLISNIIRCMFTLVARVGQGKRIFATLKKTYYFYFILFFCLSRYGDYDHKFIIYRHFFWQGFRCRKPYLSDFPHWFSIIHTYIFVQCGQVSLLPKGKLISFSCMYLTVGSS